MWVYLKKKRKILKLIYPTFEGGGTHPYGTMVRSAKGRDWISVVTVGCADGCCFYKAAPLLCLRSQAGERTP